MITQPCLRPKTSSLDKFLNSNNMELSPWEESPNLLSNSPLLLEQKKRISTLGKIEKHTKT